MSYIDHLPETEEIFIDSDLKTEYITILKESNKLVKHLTQDIEKLQASLLEERTRNAELQAKLELYYETGVSNISRFTFRNYVKAATQRDETQSEWMHFIHNFNYVEKGLSKKIYEWIDYHILKQWSRERPSPR
jgi:Xaa-Pro aminopeptidase